MPKGKTSRKQQFRAALALAGMTAVQWTEREGISVGHLSQVLNEDRESASLIEKVDAFIEKHLISKQSALAS